MNSPRRLLFLPGAGGSASFWQPVASRMPASWESVLLSWPGLGDEPADPAIEGIDGLVSLALAYVDRPVDLIAQSMGGIVAVQIALARPELVRRMVLTCCSGGLAMSELGAEDWRPAYRAEFPRAAPWITDPGWVGALAFEGIAAPTLLLWGDCDPVSPVAVGRRLAKRIPMSRLEIVAGAGHDLALAHASAAAELIRAHLEAELEGPPPSGTPGMSMET